MEKVIEPQNDDKNSKRINAVKVSSGETNTIEFATKTLTMCHIISQNKIAGKYLTDEIKLLIWQTSSD